MLIIATIASGAKAFTLFNQWDKVIYKESVCQVWFSPISLFEL